MNTTCIYDTDNKISTEFIEGLTQEEREELGITNDRLKEVAKHALSTQIEMELAHEDPEELDALLNDKKAMAKKIKEKLLSTARTTQEEVDDANEELEAIMDGLETSSYIGASYYEDTEQGRTEAKKREELLNSFGTVWAHLQEKPVEIDVNGETKKVLVVYHVLKKPVLSKQKTAQQKAVDAIHEIASLSEKREFGKYWYNNKLIKATSVSKRLGQIDDSTIPIASRKIGSNVDTIGRRVFEDPDRLRNATDEELKELNEEANNIFSLEGLKALIEDFRKLEEDLKKQFGDDIVIITEEVRLLAEDKDGWVVGVPDMFVVDGKGTIHMLDFKTHKIHGLNNTYIDVFTDRMNDKFGTRERYADQLSYYVKMLQSFGLDVAEEAQIIVIDSYYYSDDTKANRKAGVKETYRVSDTFGDNSIAIETDTGDVLLGEYSESQGHPTRESLNESNGKALLYIEPRLHAQTETVKTGEREEVMSTIDKLDALRILLFNDDITVFKNQSNLLSSTKPEKEDSSTDLFDAKELGNVRKLAESDIESRPDIITRQEIRALAEELMYRVSSVVTRLSQEGTYVGPSISENIARTCKGLSREDVLRRVGVKNIIEDQFRTMIHNNVYYMDGVIEKKIIFPSEKEYKDDDYDKEFFSGLRAIRNEQDFKRKQTRFNICSWLDSHKNQFIMAGAQKLMELEGCVVPFMPSTSKKGGSSIAVYEDNNEEAEEDNGNSELMRQYVDLIKDGLSEKEAWMFGVRNISNKSSLSKEVRRMLARLYDEGKDGRAQNPVLERLGDTMGYFGKHLDITKAINTIFNITRKCETWEEMRFALAEAAKLEGNEWIGVLDKDGRTYKRGLLKVLEEKGNENIKVKFFRNFRKDFIAYSISEPRFDKKTGKRIVRTRIVNLNPANTAMRASLTRDYEAGKIGTFNLYGKDLLKDNSKVEDKQLTLLQRDNEGVFKATKGPSQVHVANSVKKYATRWQTLITEIKKDVDNELRGQEYQGLSREEKKEKRRELLIERLTKTKYDQATLKESENGITVVQAVTECLDALGIHVTENVVHQSTLKKVNNLLSLLKQVKSGMDTMTSPKATFEGLDSSLGNAQMSVIDLLAEEVEQVIESSVYQDGKTYYSFTNPSYLGSVIRNMKNELDDDQKFQRYLKNNFDRYSLYDYGACAWVNLLRNNEDARAAFSHKSELTYSGNQYSDLDSLSFQLSILHNYFGSTYDQNQKWHWYALPTMSNKPVNEFIRMQATELSTNEEKEKEFYRNLFLTELARISDVLMHYSQGKTGILGMDLNDGILADAGYDEDDIAKLKERIDNGELTADDVKKLAMTSTGAKFHFLWYLSERAKTNDDFAETLANLYNTVLVGNDELGDNEDAYYEYFDTIENEIVPAIQEELEDVVEAELDRMDKIGLFTVVERAPERGSKEKTKHLKYQEEFMTDKGALLGESTGNLEKDLAEMKKHLRAFIKDDIIANINIILMTGGDLAYYGNSVKYQKRIAQIHSPGIKVMNDPEVCDGFLRSVHISDSRMRKSIVPALEYAFEQFVENSGMTQGQKEDYNKMASLVISEVKKALVTDGQSYNSPSSIMKKLTMMGEMDDDTREALEQIRKGNFNVNNLSVLMQPEKPFLTAMLAKPSCTRKVTMRKVPLQDKNSEYLILLADAIIQGSGQRNKFTAICEFMESTHKLGDGRHGIDTVHFESVGKVGVSGVIDLDAFDERFNEELEAGLVDEKDYNDELVKYMQRHIYRYDEEDESKSLQTKEASDAMNALADDNLLLPEETYYNPDYVDTVPVEAYIVQQEVPSHELDNEMLSGSQNRILGISDITPGTNFDIYTVGKDGKKKKSETLTAEDLIDEYQELWAENINESYRDLMKEIGLDPDGSFENIYDLQGKERNRVFTNLSNLLRKELFNDNSYDLDLRRCCELIYDDNGDVVDFAIPLGDPKQANRIENLLHSIIKKRINKQTTKGMSLVQTTAFDRNLHIRFKDSEGNELPLIDLDGLEEGTEEYIRRIKEYKQMLKDKKASIAYFECYAPITDPVLQALLTNPDGSMMSVEQAKKVLKPEVWEEITKMIGYRIPTEDKYSIMPLKIVGFMPKAAGQAIMLPQEITFLTGSDFDIDKMYCMMKSFDYATQLVGIGNLDNAGKIVDQYIAKGGAKFDGINDVAKQLMTNAEALLKKDRLHTWTTGIDTGNQNAMRFLEWYRGNLLHNMFAEQKDTKNGTRKSRRQARNNRLFDLEWAVLTNNDTLVKQLNIGNFNRQKKISKMIELIQGKAVNQATGKLWKWEELQEMSIKQLEALLETGEAHSVTLPSSKIYFQRQNMEGGKMVGIFANNNVSHAFCSLKKLGVNLNKKGMLYFILNDTKIGDTDDIIQFDRQIGFDGQYISKTIASFLAAAVDTAKDPTLTNINVNTCTADIAMVLARLGFDTETIALFLSQPIIIKLADLYFKRNAEFYFTREDAVMEIIKDLGVNRKTLTNLDDLRNKGDMNTEEFIKHLTDTPIGKDNWSNEYDSPQQFQFRVLQLFYVLNKMAGDMQKLTYVTKFNSVTNAGGPTLSDTFYKRDRYQEYLDTLGDSFLYVPVSDNKISDGKKDEFDDPAKIVEDTPILNAFYTTTVAEHVGAIDRIFGSFFYHYLPGFQEVRNRFMNEVLGSKKIDAKLNTQLLNAYLYFILTYDNEEEGIRPVLPSSLSDKDRLVNGLVEEFNYVKGIERDKGDKKGRRYNLLLDNDKLMFVRAKDSFLGLDTLHFSRGGLDIEHQQEAIDAWTDLITMQDPNLSEEDNKRIRRFAVDLFFYSLMRNGFSFSPKTMMTLASYVVRYNATYDRKSTVNYVDGTRINHMRNLDYIAENDPEMIDMFLDQFVRNNSSNAKLSPKFSEDNPVFMRDLVDEDTGEVVGIGITIQPDEQNKLFPFVTDNEGKVAHKFITLTRTVGRKGEKKQFKTQLCRVSLHGRDSVYTDNLGNLCIDYEFISELGLKSNFVEYDANDNEYSTDNTMTEEERMQHNLSVSFFADVQLEDSENDELEEDYSNARNNDSESSEKTAKQTDPETASFLSDMKPFIVKMADMDTNQAPGKQKRLRKVLTSVFQGGDENNPILLMCKELLSNRSMDAETQSRKLEELQNKCANAMK